MTTRTGLSVGQAIRVHGAAYMRAHGNATTPAQRQMLERLAVCRTAALGGHVLECDHCGERRVAYNSCRDRHCPTCLNHKSREWLDARREELLPVSYFHVVFTVPAPIARLALGNKKVVYGILFAAASSALQTLAKDPKHLGARIGFLAVLHTWDQKLQHHPHLHCVVPGGGLVSAEDGDRWISAREGFFLPVRPLSRLYRGKFLDALLRAHDDGELRLPVDLESAADFDDLIRRCRKQDWVVYAKAPFGSAEQVLKYLARYTHRVAISNARLVGIDAAHVRFRYRNRTEDNRQATMTLTGAEFLRRLTLHVLPKGFTRIRHFGFFANRNRKAALELCRDLLGAPELPMQEPDTAAPEPGHDRMPRDGDTCPACQHGTVHCVETLDETPHRWLDTS